MKRLLLPFVIGAALGLGVSGGIAYFRPAPTSLQEALAEATASAETGAESESPAGGPGGAPEDEGGSVLIRQSGGSLEESALPGGAAVILDAEDAGGSLATRLAGTAEIVDPSSASVPPGGVPNRQAGEGGASLAGGAASAGLAPERLARVFGSMQAREAARVLEFLDDQEVRIILGELGNREAAAILSQLTPERAAVISRSVIRSQRSVP